MPASGGRDDSDPETTWYASRRERSPSVLQYSALVIIALGLGIVAFALLNVYVPSLSDPTSVNAAPLFDLTNLVGIGITMTAFGSLAYIYASHAGV